MSTLRFRGTAYDITGREDAPAVVLIHGIGLRRELFVEFLPSLNTEFCVLTYDLPGHGESLSLEQPITLSSLSHQLLNLLDHLGIQRSALVGFSLGGMINRKIALEHPARVTALAILNSPHERSPEQQHLVEERAAYTQSESLDASLDATLQRWFTVDFLATHQESIGRVRGWFLSNDKANFAAHRNLLARGVLELIRPESIIDCPTLVMTSENDTGSTPEMAYKIAGDIPNSKVLIVPKLKHLGILEDTDAFLVPLKDFLLQSLSNTIRPVERA